MPQLVPKRLLIFCPYSAGGLADYGRAQARAITTAEDIEVLWLAPANLEGPTDSRRVGALKQAGNRAGKGIRSRIKRALGFLGDCTGAVAQLDDVIRREAPEAVLLVSYSEYFAPLWAWKLRQWRRRGIRFGAVVHDPVRDHQVGPRFWHRWSIAAAYSCLDVAFVHEPIQLDTVRPMPGLRTVVIPHGLYEFQTERWDRNDARRKLELPLEAPVFLSFGHIRDGKNLGQFIQMMAEFPEIYLIVAGKEQSGGQKQASYYKELALACCVDSRIRWDVRHVPESETGLFFGAADHLLLTYSSDFRSASGVLAAAAQFETPVLASGGEGPMKSAIQRYRLGHFADPSDPNSLRAGIQEVLTLPSKPDWEGFTKAHSWDVNASAVVKALFGGSDLKRY